MIAPTVNTVTLNILGGPQFVVPYIQGMNAQQVLESASAQALNPSDFTYALQYFGPKLGYLVLMINETYESFMSTSHPFFFWEFLVNDVPSQTGIDGTLVNAGDIVSFSFITFDPVQHTNSTLQAKFDLRTGGLINK